MGIIKTWLTWLFEMLTRMCLTGEAPDRAIKNIAQKFETSRSNAVRLVQTESAFAASAARQDCFKELDVERYQICATLDSRTSTICQDMDLKVFPMREYEAGVTAPPFHPRCRTTTAPAVDDEWMKGATRAAKGEDGKTYYVPEDMSYKEWKNDYVEKGKKFIEKSSTSGIMKLPRNNELTIPKEKFIEYALNPQKDANKARAFKEDLGYDLSNFQDLIDDINRKVSQFPATEKPDQVVIKLKGPNGKKAKVLTAWIDDNENGQMRLTTAYVDK